MPATFQVLNSRMCMVAAMSEHSFRLWWFSKHNMFLHLGRLIIETVGTHLIDYGPGFPFSVMLCGLNCNSLLFPETNQDDWPTSHIFDLLVSVWLKAFWRCRCQWWTLGSMQLPWDPSKGHLILLVWTALILCKHQDLCSLTSATQHLIRSKLDQV